MHATYIFDFLTTVSRQLVEKLDALPVTPLWANLEALAAFQRSNGSAQGVYLLYESDKPRYLGKADRIHSRLKQHLRKLSGRRNITIADVGYKALFLDKSMGTAANEDLLIRLYQHEHPEMWNGQGFGPKDPGKQRDTTDPSEFDRDHPIIREFEIGNVQDHETVGTLFLRMKTELPYVFRFDIGSAKTETVLLNGVERNAEALLRTAMMALPEGYYAAILSYGMVVYHLPRKQYPIGVDIIKSGRV